MHRKNISYVEILVLLFLRLRWQQCSYLHRQALHVEDNVCLYMYYVCSFLAKAVAVLDSNNILFLHFDLIAFDSKSLDMHSVL